MLKHLNDKKRAQELLGGEESDFKAFFDEYFPRLYRFARERLTGSPDATEEIVQNTLSKTILNLDKYKGESTLFTWICAICKNEIYDFQKKRSRYQNSIVLCGSVSDLEASAESSGLSAPERPDDYYIRDQKTRRIHKTLDQLPANYGKVIEWKYISGLSVVQIAERLELSQPATQSLLFRARAAFQECFGEMG